MTTQFDYLLNSFEQASQADKPAEHGYGGHRRALYAYVRNLEAAAKAEPAEQGAQPEAADALLADVVKWHAFGTSLPRKIEGFGSVGAFNVFAIDLWKRIHARLADAERKEAGAAIRASSKAEGGRG